MSEVSEKNVDTHIKRLRRKAALIEPGSSALSSIYGLGNRHNPQYHADDA